MYLIDTDWIIDYLKGREKAVKALQSLFEEELYVSIISLAEIYEGITETKNKEKAVKALDDFLSCVAILNINIEICQKFGEIRNILRKEGKLIGNFDILIAATAIVNDLEIVTDNKEDFSKINEVKFYM